MESYFEYEGFFGLFECRVIPLPPVLIKWILLPLEEHLESTKKVILFSVGKKWRLVISSIPVVFTLFTYK